MTSSSWRQLYFEHSQLMQYFIPSFFYNSTNVKLLNCIASYEKINKFNKQTFLNINKQ